MKPMQKKWLAALGGMSLAAVAGALYMRFVESRWIETTEKSINLNRFTPPLRILHLSDFHASNVVSLDYIDKAVATALACRPDLILLTGDFVTHTIPERARYRKILSKLGNSTPTFACLGNHDGGRWAASHHSYSDSHEMEDLLSDSNIHLLFNDKQQIEIKGQPLIIAGLGDCWSGDTLPDQVLSRQRDADIPLFVLCHNPDSIPELMEYDWDITFCGHTHGGQFTIPWLGLRPFLPVQNKIFNEGLFRFDGRYVHITRGVGCLYGLRLNCRPEISVLHIQ